MRKWTCMIGVLFLLFNHCEKFHLKLRDECRFIGGPKGNYYIKTVMDDADVLNADIDGKNIVINVDTKSGQVFDVRQDNHKLIFYPKHGQFNQQFTMKVVEKGEYGRKIVKIEGFGGCMEYIPDEDQFKFNKCNPASKDQSFEFREYLDLKCNFGKYNVEDDLFGGNAKHGDFINFLPDVHTNGMIDSIYPTRLISKYIISQAGYKF